MKILVVLKQVPDLIEELELDDSGTRLDFEMLKVKLNEFDDHALEEALLLKEEHGGEVVAVTADGGEAERLLFTALAKGAERAVKVTGVDPHAENHVLAPALAGAIRGEAADLILTGVQAPGDRDGQLGPLLAACLDCPVVSVVTGVRPGEGQVVVNKEYAGGVMAEFEVSLPAVLGIQAARQSPRYAPVSKVRQVQQSAKLESAAGAGEPLPSAAVKSMAPPPKGQGARMLANAAELLEILKQQGVA